MREKPERRTTGAGETADAGGNVANPAQVAQTAGETGAAGRAGAAGATGLSRRALRALLAPYALALPAAMLVAVFVYGVVGGVLQGFGIMPFLDMTTPTLEYYAQALTRSDLASSIGFSLYVSLLSSAIALVGGVALAAALTRLRTGRFAQLVALQIPIMTMHALVAMAVAFVFSGSGLAARLLHVVGFIETPGDFSSVVGAASGWGIVLVYAWKEIPYLAFCTVTVMAHVSSSLGEAALTCGATRRQAFFGVTLPLCAPAALRAFLVVFVFALGSYEVPFLLGPTAPKALPVLAYIEFQDPDIVNRCYAMALNGLSAALCSVAALLYFALLRRERRRGGEGGRR